MVAAEPWRQIDPDQHHYLSDDALWERWLARLLGALIQLLSLPFLTRQNPPEHRSDVLHGQLRQMAAESTSLVVSPHRRRAPRTSIGTGSSLASCSERAYRPISTRSEPRGLLLPDVDLTVRRASSNQRATLSSSPARALSALSTACFRSANRLPASSTSAGSISAIRAGGSPGNCAG
jgi:hypothetical protein